MTDKLIAGEELIWEGRPSWRSEMSFYLKWLVIALIPLIILLAIGNFADQNWAWAGPGSSS